MARLRSDIWVAAYLRICQAAGAFTALRRRGAAEAGAIFIKIDCLDGTCRLLGPAPAGMGPEDDGSRRFAPLHASGRLAAGDAEARMKREIGFDSDLWWIEVEDREGRDFLDSIA